MATIVSRGFAGGLADGRGAKIAVRRGLVFYVAGALVSLVSGLVAASPTTAYVVLIAGRLLIGIGIRLQTKRSEIRYRDLTAFDRATLLEVAKHPHHLIRWAVLVINILVVLYMVYVRWDTLKAGKRIEQTG